MYDNHILYDDDIVSHRQHVEPYLRVEVTFLVLVAAHLEAGLSHNRSHMIVEFVCQINNIGYGIRHTRL